MPKDWTSRPGTLSRVRRFLEGGGDGSESALESSANVSGRPNENDIRRIARRLERAAKPGGATTAAEAEGIARTLVARANASLQKLDGAPLGRLAAEEAAALEAVIHVRGRPAVRVLGETLEDIRIFPESDLWVKLFDGHRQRVMEATRASAAVTVRDNLLPQMSWVQGTAVRIGENLALTNRHVLMPTNGGVRLARRIAGTTEGRLKKTSYAVGLDFAFDNGPEREIRYHVTGIPFIAADDDPVDAAVLEIAPVEGGEAATPPQLAISKEDIFDIDRLYVIGHPGRLPLVSDNIQTVFGNPDERKRVSFGTLMDPHQAKQVHIVHDASTIGGFSGGAVHGFAGTELMALHYWGDSANGNRAIAARALRRHKALGRILKKL